MIRGLAIDRGLFADGEGRVASPSTHPQRRKARG